MTLYISTALELLRPNLPPLTSHLARIRDHWIGTSSRAAIPPDMIAMIASYPDGIDPAYTASTT